jgi:hypothetical protein
MPIRLGHSVGGDDEPVGWISDRLVSRDVDAGFATSFQNQQTSIT